MSRDTNNQRRNRIVVQTSSAHYRNGSRLNSQPRPREGLTAISLIAAAMLATFLALFLTSRPFDPMNSSIAAQPDVPPGQLAMQPSPKPSPSPSPTPELNQNSTAAQSPEPGGGNTATVIDDAAIQTEIEKLIAADATLSKLDIDTIVEGGKVTIVGSVRSPELKQRVGKAVRSVKGVSTIDNQLAIIEATP